MIIQELNGPDIITYAKLCRETRAVVKDERAPFWRCLFARKYDLPQTENLRWLAPLYKNRERILQLRPKFETGNTDAEKFVLSVIRGLIIGRVWYITVRSSPLTFR